MSIATQMVRDDAGAMMLARQAGLTIPPMFERLDGPLGTTFRAMVMGWRVEEVESGRERGFIVAVPSSDMEDWEIIAEGGWCVNGARKLFHDLFRVRGLPRVSARCNAENARNIRVLTLMGFVEEGRRRLHDRTEVLFGMLAGECRLLGRAA
jgi:hypothetical protein